MWPSALGLKPPYLDTNPSCLAYVRDIMQGHVITIMSNSANIEEEVLKADLVIRIPTQSEKKAMETNKGKFPWRVSTWLFHFIRRPRLPVSSL